MRKFACVLFFIFFLSGCATFSPSEEVFKEKASINSRTYDASVNACFDTLKQVILKKNFSLASEDKEAKRLQATRYFQKERKSIVIVLNANLQSLGENKTAVYLNAVQTTEKLYKPEPCPFFPGPYSFARWWRRNRGEIEGRGNNHTRQEILRGIF